MVAANGWGEGGGCLGGVGERGWEAAWGRGVI